MHYLSHSCCLPEGNDRQKRDWTKFDVGGLFGSARLWRSLIIAIVFLRGLLMNFHTSDSLVRFPFSDSIALLFHTIPSELCITLSFSPSPSHSRSH